MFEITLLPVAIHEGKTTEISASGFTLNYNNTPYDFSVLEDGDQVEAQDPAQGLIKKIDGVIHITLRYQYVSRTAKPHQPDMQLNHTLDNASLVSPVELMEAE